MNTLKVYKDIIVYQDSDKTHRISPEDFTLHTSGDLQYQLITDLWNNILYKIPIKDTEITYYDEVEHIVIIHNILKSVFEDNVLYDEYGIPEGEFSIETISEDLRWKASIRLDNYEIFQVVVNYDSQKAASVYYPGTAEDYPKKTRILIDSIILMIESMLELKYPELKSHSITKEIIK